MQTITTTWAMQIKWSPAVATPAVCTLPTNLVCDTQTAIATVQAKPLSSAHQKHNLLVLKCVNSTSGKVGVLKIRCPASEFKAEGTKLIRMYTNVGIAALMPPLRAFVKIAHKGKNWGGVYMDHYDMPVNSIIFPQSGFDTKPVEASFERARPDGSADRGVGLRYTPAGLQTATIVACMELLQRMHALGWVHGDTHLGNFLLSTTTWCVVAIDVERAFPTDDAGQHLMDMQELFGHATGLLLSSAGGWDMLDINGVFNHMHPAAGAASKRRHDVMRLLPICTCFACDNADERMDGCGMCQSTFYVRAVEHYAAAPQSYVDALASYTLKRATAKVAAKRATVRAMLETIAGPLMLQLPSLDPAIYGKERSRSIDHYNDWVSTLLFSPDDTQFKRVIAGLVELNRPEADSVAELISRTRVPM